MSAFLVVFLWPEDELLYVEQVLQFKLWKFASEIFLQERKIVLQWLRLLQGTNLFQDCK